MITLATVFVLFLLWELLRKYAAPFNERQNRVDPRTAVAITAILCVVLVAAFWQEMRWLTDMIAVQKNKPAWLALAPAQWLVREGTTTHATATFLITVFEGLILAGLYFVLRDAYSRAAGVLVGIACVGMVLIAAFTPITNPDVYAYIGYGKLGLAASYAPPHVAFPGAFSVINDRWGTPMLASDYGPLFIALQSLLVGGVHALSTAFAIERAFDVAVFGCVLLLLRNLGAKPAVLAIAALNPALLYLDITTAHNDLFAVLLLLLGFALVRRYPWLAVAAVVAAGLTKIVFCVAGLIVFADLQRNTAVRIAYAAASVAVCALVLWLIGGHAYVASLIFVSKVQLAHIPLRLIMLQRVFEVIALAAIAVAVIVRRWLGAAMWTMPALGARIYPWYVVWSLPYALRANALPAFLIPLPAIAFASDPLFVVNGLVYKAVLGAIVIAMVAIAVRSSRRRPVAAAYTHPSR